MRQRVKPTKDHQIESLVASTSITSPADLKRLKRINRVGDAEAWKWYGRIGEVHFGLASAAREASRVSLQAVRWTGPKSFRAAGGLPRDLIGALQSRNGGQAHLISSFFLNRKVTGDGFLLGYPQAPASEDMWFDYLSTDELDNTSVANQGAREDTKVRRKTSALQANTTGMGNGRDEFEEYPLSQVILSRIWTPHPRYSEDADGPLKALHLICEELDILTMSLKAKITSRLAMAGILYLAHNLQIALPEAPSTSAERFADDPLVDYLMRTMTQAIMSPDEPTATIPIIIRGPQGELDNMLRLISMEREVFATDISQREELIKRILAGLDFRPENVEGFSESNHWSAWSTQDVHLKIDVAPDIEALCWAVTKDYLWPQLRAAVEAGDLSAGRWTEPEIRRHWCWYDMTNLTVRPNQANEFQSLWDRAEISGDALREATGATKEQAPDDNERVRIFGMKHGFARLAVWGLPVHDELEDEDLMKVAPKPGPEPSADEDAPVGPGVGDDRGAPGEGDSDEPASERPDG